MDKQKDKKFSLHSLFARNSFVFVFSLIIALISWSAVAFMGDVETDYPIENVTIELPNRTYGVEGLEILNQNLPSVKVTVRCSRIVASRLTDKSVKVAPDTGDNPLLGTHDYQLIATINSNEQFEIVSIEPSSVSLNFGRKDSRTFSISTGGVTATAAKGYYIDNSEITVFPSEVIIYGDSDELARIASVGVQYEFSDVLTKKQQIADLPILLYDEYGEELSMENIAFSEERVSLTVPVYKLRTIRVGVQFNNVPEGLDTSFLQYTLSAETIEIAGPEDKIDAFIEPWIVYIDLSTFDLNKEFVCDIRLPLNIINRSANTVTVTFAQDNLSSTTINVTDIRLRNPPANFDITVLDSVIKNVRVIGNSEDIAELLPGSVIAEIDFSQIVINDVGQRSVNVVFRITSNNRTFVTGSYPVLIDVQAKTTA